jgi:alkyl hydroperoxide reductase subunit F
VGGKALWSSDVENYLGFHLLDGVDLVKKFRDHLLDYKDAYELKEGELVTSVEKSDKKFIVFTATQKYETRAVLITTGEINRTLNIPGEKELTGHGVAYCAACDAPLCKDKIVYVIGGGNSAMDAAIFTAKYATHVTLVCQNAELAGDSVMKQTCLTSPAITVLTSTKTSKILGDTSVSGIGLVGSDGVERIEQTQWVFIEIGLTPVSQFIDSVAKNKWGEIVVDKHNQTSVPGIFAAGDVTDVTEKQISVAVGEGSKAALQLIKFLQTTPV